jgi:predicted MFS family arabinose efflux permease
MQASDGELRSGWRVVVAAAFGVGVGLTGATIFSLGAFLVPLSHAMGWTRGQVSVATLFLVTGTVVTAPFVGRACDRIGVRRIGLVSLLALSLAYLAMTLVTRNVFTFYAGLLVLSLAGCGTTPTIWTRGVATWFDARRGLALGLTLVGTGVAAIVMPPFVGGLITSYDWRAGYVGLAGVTLLAMLPVFLYFFEAGREGRGATRAAAVHAGFDTRQALATRRFWQLGIANLVVTAAISALIVHLVALLGDAGMARGTALWVAGLLGGAVVVGRLSMGFAIDRLHAPYVAAVFLLMPCIGCVILSVAPQSLTLACIAAGSIGLAGGSEVDLLAYLTSRYFGLKSYGEIYGWQFLLFEIGVGIGPVLAGRAYDHDGSYHFALQVAAVAFAVGAVAIGTLGRSPAFTPRTLAASPAS